VSHFKLTIISAPASSWPRGSMFRPKWEHHTVSDQFPDWVCCGYWECEHCQVHSWEV